MALDWRRLSREAGLEVDGDAILVSFPDERSQRVYVEVGERPGLVRVWSFVARPSAVQQYEMPHIFAWERNAQSDLVGFKVDGRSRMVGEAWVPTAGLEKDEWRIYVETVAMATDRLEYLMTGRDAE